MAESRKRTSKRKSAPKRGPDPTSAGIEKFEASEEAKNATPSAVDAMGKEKRRHVIGQAYGPSRSSQFLVLGSVLAVMGILIVGFVVLANYSDSHPSTKSGEAPWAQADAPQHPAVRPQ